MNHLYAGVLAAIVLGLLTVSISRLRKTHTKDDYLVAGRSGLWTRIWHLLAAAATVVVSGGWYVLLVALWPCTP